jgi:hypothetical protein
LIPKKSRRSFQPIREMFPHPKHRGSGVASQQRRHHGAVFGQ